MEEDSSRHYKNPFPDFSIDNPDSFIDAQNRDITQSFKSILQQKIHDFVRRLEDNEHAWIRRNDSSIYTGNPGISYLSYYYGKVFNNSSYLNRSLKLIEQPNSAKIDKRSITFLTGEAGRLALGAVINHSLNNNDKSAEMISRLKSMYKYAAASEYDELLYGRAGYLYCLLFVNKNISPNSIDGDLIKQIILLILNSGRKYATSKRLDTPLMYSWHDTEYLGGAHGLAGILYILLQAREYLTEDQLNDIIKPSIDYLSSLRFQSMNFPSSNENKSDRLIHWCHGAPSMTMLFILAAKVFNERKYFDIAQDCGEVVWARGLLKKGCGICHGVSGNAYTFLSLFQETQDPKYLYRSVKFAEWCFDYDSRQNRQPDRPFSLFEGLAGIIYFFIDLLNPEASKFPGYTL